MDLTSCVGVWMRVGVWGYECGYGWVWVGVCMGVWKCEYISGGATKPGLWPGPWLDSGLNNSNSVVLISSNQKSCAYIVTKGLLLFWQLHWSPGKQLLPWFLGMIRTRIVPWDSPIAIQHTLYIATIRFTTKSLLSFFPKKPFHVNCSTHNPWFPVLVATPIVLKWCIMVPSLIPMQPGNEAIIVPSDYTTSLAYNFDHKGND